MSNSKRTSTPITSLFVRTHNSVQERLIYLRDIKGCKWRKIAEMPEFGGIPLGTLYSIYRSGVVPRKWWKALDMQAIEETTRIAISKVDMESAARTIYNNLGRESIIALIVLLEQEV